MILQGYKEKRSCTKQDRFWTCISSGSLCSRSVYGKGTVKIASEIDAKESIIKEAGNCAVECLVIFVHRL